MRELTAAEQMAVKIGDDGKPYLSGRRVHYIAELNPDSRAAKRRRARAAQRVQRLMVTAQHAAARTGAGT